MTKVKIISRLLSLLLVPLALTGCISLLSSNSKNDPPPSIYTLHPPGSGSGELSKQTRTAAVIVVPTPEVPTGFDTERIALYFEQGNRLDYYANAQWSGRLDDLLRDFIIQSARRDFPGAVIGTTELADSAKYKLMVKITALQPVYSDGPDGVPRLDAAMTVTLIAIPGGAVKASVSAKNSVPASANRLSAVTSGLEALLGSVTDQALRQIAPQLAAP